MYGKKEAKMTRGFAILCMLTLHLFCRKGEDVYGTPLIWINDTTPLVYYFGFFAEICVPLYTLCAGYAQQVMSQKLAGGGIGLWKDNLKRVWRLLVNYWVILVLFSILGIVFPSDGSMPGTVQDFFKSIILIHSYNGAWWFLNTYILLMLIPPKILLFPLRKLGTKWGMALCLVFQFAYYIAAKFGIWPEEPFIQPAAAFLWGLLDDFIRVLPYYWAGAFLCKGNVVDQASNLIQKFLGRNRNTSKDRSGQKEQPQFASQFYWNFFIFAMWALLFAGVSIIHQAILMPTISVLVFLLFNLWKKGNIPEKIFLFLGKHSTNIWLTHMFFYLCLFRGTAQKAQYPLFMFISLLAMSLGASVCINCILLLLQKAGRKILHAES